MSAPHAPVVIDPEAHVSRHIARRVRELIGQVRVWSIDGHDLRQYRGYKDAGVRLPRPTLVRGHRRHPPAGAVHRPLRAGAGPL